MWWDHMGGYGYGGWAGFGMISMILFWIILVLVIGVLWRLFAHPQSSGRIPEKTAVQILEERYARGEIGKEEFLAKRKDLTGGGGGA